MKEETEINLDGQKIKEEIKAAGREIKEEFEVTGKDLWETIKKFAHEVNVRKLIVKKADGEPIVSIPITVASVAFILVPFASFIGGLVALASDFKIEVVKVVPDEEKPATEQEPPKQA